MSNIVVKFQWNNELRRVTIENTQTFEQIGNLIKNLFKDAPASFSLKYRDEDGDVIILSSDIELKEAFKSSPVRFVIVDTTSKNKVETKKEEVDQDDDEDDEQDLPFNFLFKLLSALPSERRNTVPAPRCDGPHKLFGIPIIPQSQKHQNPLSTQYPTPFLKVRPQQPVESETIKIPIPTLGPFFKIRPAQLQNPVSTQASQKIPIRFASQPSDETDQSLPNVEKTPETGPTEKIPVETTTSTMENTNASVETTPAVESDLTIPEEPTTSEQHIEESSEKDIENTETQEPGKVHPFESNLNQLESMGFVDREENIRLLVNNNGDIVKTVADLLN